MRCRESELPVATVSNVVLLLARLTVFPLLIFLPLLASSCCLPCTWSLPHGTLPDPPLSATLSRRGPYHYYHSASPPGRVVVVTAAGGGPAPSPKRLPSLPWLGGRWGRGGGNVALLYPTMLLQLVVSVASPSPLSSSASCRLGPRLLRRRFPLSFSSSLPCVPPSVCLLPLSPSSSSSSAFFSSASPLRSSVSPLQRATPHERRRPSASVKERFPFGILPAF